MTAVTFIFIVGFRDRARSQTVNTVGVVGTRDAQETIADNPVPADRRMNLLINISFSYFAAPFARPIVCPVILKRVQDDDIMAISFAIWQSKTIQSQRASSRKACRMRR